MTRLVVCVLCTAVLVAMSACSTPSTVNGVPAPVSASPPNRYGAPDVDDPRDVRPFDADPCSLLTTAQLRDFGLATTGRQRTTVTDEHACTWGAGTVDEGASVILVPNRDALADAYRGRALPIFEPTLVGGLPAVRQQSSPISADCRIVVGTDASQGFVLSYYVNGTPAGEIPDDPCGRGLRVAEQVVANLPPLTKN